MGRDDHRHRRLAAGARGDRDHVDAGGRREGRLRALHAQGDDRAAAGAAVGHHRPRHPRGPDPPRRAGRDCGTCCAPWTASSSWRAAPRSTRRSSAPTCSRRGPGCRRDRRSGSEFRYSPPPLDERTLVIAVTQSGETADTIAPVRLARERGCPIIAITNTVGSAITREADAVLFLQAGPEVAVAASKTFVTQVALLVMLAAAIGRVARDVARWTMRSSSAGRCGGCPEQAQRAIELSRRAPRRSRAATSIRAASCSSGAA